MHYAVPWPNREMARAATSGAPRCTNGWRQRGAWFGAGWAGSGPTFHRRHPAALHLGQAGVADDCIREQHACRSDVAVFDQTSFSKYVVSGPGALETLQWVCAADVDVRSAVASTPRG